MSSTIVLRRFIGSFVLLFFLCVLPPVAISAEKEQKGQKEKNAPKAQSAQRDKGEEKAPFDPSKAKDAGVGMPTPYDKFIALDQVLTKTKVKWDQTFRKVAVDIDPDSFTDKDVAVP